jgi:hypothetical protein
MSKPKFAHEIICCKGRLKIVQMDAERASHQHVLWSLYNLSIDLEQIASFQRFEAKEVIVKIS